ncbi:MAG: calcineurin-like phosphoesterase family protein [Alistipes sp.]|nr:calcineurin-like phosphoesterase family protein [Alistipes sp.]
MKRLFILLALASVFAVANVGCTKSDEKDPNKQEPVDPDPPKEDEIDWSKVDSKATVRGVVRCEGVGVQGVVVTDGVNMTRTNKQGAYGLRTSSAKSNLVYLTVPSGYEVSSTHGFIPLFYRKITAATSVDKVQQFDFTLKKRNNDNHIMIVSADMHIRNRSMISSTSATTPSICPPKGELDSVTFRRTYLKYLREYVKTLPAGVPVYGLNLGDMTQETHWTNSKYKATLSNFVTVCERGGMPIQMFHCIGNHDHDMAVKDITTDDDSQAELAYNAVFGPTYYSFNIGKVHYVVLDNTQYRNTGGNRSYDVHLNTRQMEWAQKDANYMTADVERIVIAWHCPAFRRNSAASSPQPLDNANDLLNIYKDKNVPVTILSGHNHIAETVTPRADMDVTEYTHPCVCGAWWFFPLCHDGAPATFTRYDFSGGALTKRQSVNFNDENEQYYRVYNAGQTNASGKAVIRINVWDWHTSWKIECRENGVVVPASQIQRINTFDKRYGEVHDACGNKIDTFDFLNNYYTDHILEYTPVTQSADIQISVLDETGTQLFVINTKLQQ